MNFTIAEFMKLGLSPTSYFYLYAIITEDESLLNHIKNKLTSKRHNQVLTELQSNGYIKLNADFTWKARQKFVNLQRKIKPEIDFDVFWHKYHKVTKLKKTDLQAALKHWSKLTNNEKELALNNIQPYFNSLPTYSTGKPVKKARTYLSDKNFNDEFKPVPDGVDINRMI